MPSLEHCIFNADIPSFWFLFPVANFAVFGIADAEAAEAEHRLSESCFGCDKPFPSVSLPLVFEVISADLTARGRWSSGRRKSSRRDDQSDEPVPLRQMLQRFLHGVRFVYSSHATYLPRVFTMIDLTPPSSVPHTCSRKCALFSLYYKCMATSIHPAAAVHEVRVGAGLS